MVDMIFFYLNVFSGLVLQGDFSTWTARDFVLGTPVAAPNFLDKKLGGPHHSRSTSTVLYFIFFMQE